MLCSNFRRCATFHNVETAILNILGSAFPLVLPVYPGWEVVPQCHNIKIFFFMEPTCAMGFSVPRPVPCGPVTKIRHPNLHAAFFPILKNNWITDTTYFNWLMRLSNKSMFWYFWRPFGIITASHPKSLVTYVITRFKLTCPKVIQ